MITSNISGIRLLPLYKTNLSYIRRMYTDGPTWFFSGAPAFEAVTEGSIADATVKLVNYHTGVEATVTANQETLQFNGSTYKINKVTENTNTAKGIYYYKVSFGQDIFYSPVFAVTCTHDVVVRYSHTCKSVLTGTSTHINSLLIPDARIVPAGVEGNQKGTELSNGTLNVTSSHVRTVWRTEVLASRDLYERLDHIRQFDSISIYAFGTVYQVQPNTFKVEGGQPTGRTFTAVLSFQIQGVDEIPNCECPEFTDDGDEGNGGGSSTDAACPNLAVSIDSSNLPQLSAAVSGTPAESYTTKWYKDGVFFSSANTVTAPNQNAVWQLRVKMDTCLEKSATYTYVNECNIFRIIEQIEGSTLNANYENIPSGQTVTARVLDSDDTEVATGLPYTPTESGVYTIEATAGGCVKTKAVFLSAGGTACLHSTQINQVGSEFQGIVNNAPTGTTTFSWQYVDENNTITEIATTQNITPTRSGMYFFKATIGGCQATSEPRLFITHTRVEIINPVNVILDNRARYQMFNNATDAGATVLTVTKGTLPDISQFTGTPQEITEAIMERIQVHYNQNYLYPADPVSHITEYEIDNAANTITIHKAIGTWDVVTVHFTEDL